MIVKLLTEHHLEFLSLKGGCRGSSESTHVKMSNCWKYHAAAQIFCMHVTVTVIHAYLLLLLPCMYEGCNNTSDNQYITIVI